MNVCCNFAHAVTMESSDGLVIKTADTKGATAIRNEAFDIECEKTEGDHNLDVKTVDNEVSNDRRSSSHNKKEKLYTAIVLCSILLLVVGVMLVPIVLYFADQLKSGERDFTLNTADFENCLVIYLDASLYMYSHRVAVSMHVL